MNDVAGHVLFTFQIAKNSNRNSVAQHPILFFLFFLFLHRFSPQKLLTSEGLFGPLGTIRNQKTQQSSAPAGSAVVRRL